MANSTDAENMRRESESRRGPIEAARQAAALGTRQAQAGNIAPDANGYFDDETGAARTWFRLGTSRFGDGSVLK